MSNFFAAIFCPPGICGASYSPLLLEEKADYRILGSGLF